ncbi:E1 ubiquitin-activating protein uba2 [Oleoguttula sp. CCFEE 5521]
MQRRDRGTVQALGAPLTVRVKNSRVLLIGAGGIGCELLKNLVCCGFGSGYTPPNGANGIPFPQRIPGITVIDLDTIDLSNLNRQFLFRKQHIKKPKAVVAKETALQFNSAVNIDAQHASIFDPLYTVAFFRSFDIVFNALDNLAARRHVNRMCLAANVPLTESGTTGFNGQAQAIQKGVTECYDCNPKPVQKSFPICTIRSTPSQPIHCIVWAKSYLLPELFGTSEEEASDVVETDGDDQEEVKKLRVEAQALKKIRGLMGTSDFAKAVFDKVFYEDIERLKSMEEMWQTRKKPVSLHFDSIDKLNAAEGATLASQDQRSWTLAENLAVFCHSLATLTGRVQAGESSIDFDKDDKDTLDFVTSASNLRSHVFGVVVHSEWQVKQMAGNIIPAIATSNALTASLSVMLGFKVFRGMLAAESEALTSNGHAVVAKPTIAPLGGSKFIFLNPRSTERTITTQNLARPNLACPVCSPVYAELQIPSEGSATLQDLVDVLGTNAGYGDFSIATGAGVIYDPDLEDNLGTPLAELGINAAGNGFVTISDDGDDPRVDVVLSVAAAGDGASLSIEPNVTYNRLPLKPVPAAPPTESGAAPDVESATNGIAALNREKRKRGADDDDDDDEVDAATAAKRAKAAPTASDAVVAIDDDGAILLDD